MTSLTKFHAQLLNDKEELLASGEVFVDQDDLYHFEFFPGQALSSTKEVASMLRETEGATPEPVTSLYVSGTTGVGCQLHFRITNQQ
jgi:hypothetical protein